MIVPRVNLLPKRLRPKRIDSGSCRNKLFWPAESRFLAKVNKLGPLWNGTHCWVWIGCCCKHTGYGKFGGSDVVWAHRYSYSLHIGPIPEGLTIDHLCRNRRCVNPDHIEAVTQRVNCLRGEGPSGRQSRWTHCPSGHEYTPENIIWVKRSVRTHPTRRCRACAQSVALKRHDKSIEYKRKKREEARGGRPPQGRKSHCIRGHLLDIYGREVKGGGRRCLECHRIAEAARYRQKSQGKLHGKPCVA